MSDERHTIGEGRERGHGWVAGPLWGVIGACLVLVSVVAGLTSGLARPVASEEIPKFEPMTVIPRPFPPIKNPKVVSAKEADGVLRASELVLGVEVGGEARAYPINMLTGPQREIINDRLGGRAIASTW